MELNYMAVRKPSGAVKSGQSVWVRFQVPRRMAWQVRLALYQDDSPETEYPMEWCGFGEGMDYYETELRLDSGLYWYYFKCGDTPLYREQGASPWQITVYREDFQTPEWIKGGIIYHIFVDRFRRAGDSPVRSEVKFREDWGGTPEYKPDAQGIVRNHDFFGGNFEGIIQKLPYIKGLGVNAIYLSPIFEADSNHKYDTGDYMRPDEMFGSLADFERLVRAAKKLDIRIICDGVFNHTGADSRYFNKYGHYDSVGAYQSEQSPYYSWYHFGETREDYACWWGIKILPAIKKENEEFRKFVTGDGGVLSTWMERGVSSWRLDVADELSDQMLDEIRRRVKRENPEGLIIGEVWEDASNKMAYGKRRKYLLGGQLDSVMNYPLKDAVVEFVKNRKAEQLKKTLETQLENYPPQVLHCLMNILGTHDTARILTVLGVRTMPGTKEEMAEFSLAPDELENGIKRLKAASMLQMLLPGVPCIYYGDEAGMQGCGDPFNRRCYPWGSENRELMEWYRKLTRIRRTLPELKQGGCKVLYAKGGVFLFQRNGEAREVLCGVNLCSKPFQLSSGLNDRLSGNTIDNIPPEGMILAERKRPVK